MLKVFWVEDDAENIDEYTNDEFEKLFGKPIVPSSFEKTFETLEDNLVYDFVIIDIDLSKFSDRIYLEQLKNKDFPATNDSEDNYYALRPDNAGLFVFNKLLEKGFPKERILFLTANAGSAISTYDKFISHFRKSLISVPDYILKDSDGPDRLVRHIKEKKDDYLVLRRGVIESCDFLKKHIDDDNNIQFRDFVVGTKRGEPKILVEKNDVQNYLEVLAQLLPPRQPKNIDHQHRLFLRTLLHEWEDNVHPEETREKYGGDIHTFAKLAKTARNWVAHANLLEPLNEQFVAFMFLVNMRAMFSLPKAILPYEHKLLRLINLLPVHTIDIEELNNKIGIADKIINQHLNKLNISLKIQPEKKPERDKFFVEKVNDIYREVTGKPSAKEFDFKNLLLKCFFVNQKSNLTNLTTSPNDFLPTLAQHIYKPSFHPRPNP